MKLPQAYGNREMLKGPEESLSDIVERISNCSREEIAQEISLLRFGYHKLLSEANAWRLKYELLHSRVNS